MKTDMKTIICPSCGGSFDSQMAKCPYCGTLNLPGAEQEYMDKLGNLREDMEKLEQVPGQELKKAADETGRFIRRVFIGIGIVALVLGCIVGSLFAVHKWILEPAIYGPPVDAEEELLWQQENFEKLDQLYDAQSYEELLEAYQSAVTEGHTLWKWEHAEFCNLYQSIEDGCQYLQSVQEQEKSVKGTYSLLLYAEWQAAGISDSRELSEEEKEFLLAMSQPLLEDLQTRWGFDGEYRQEYEEMSLELTEDGLVRFKTVEKFIKTWYKTNGAEKR